MSPVDTVARVLDRYLDAQRSLLAATTKEANSGASAVAELNGSIEAEQKKIERLESMLHANEIRVAGDKSPAPSAMVRGEIFSDSDLALLRMTQLIGMHPGLVAKIDDDLRAIESIRRARAKQIEDDLRAADASRRAVAKQIEDELRAAEALRRARAKKIEDDARAAEAVRLARAKSLKRIVIIVIVLAVVLAGVVMDRLGKAQVAYDAAIAGLNRGDLAAFDRGIEEAGNFIPGYRAAEATAVHRDVQAHVMQLQAVVAALKRRDTSAFEVEMAALKTLDSNYWRSQAEFLQLLQRSGLNLSKFVIAGRSLVLEAPIKLDFVHVPGGNFTMGSDPQKDRSAWGSEQPQHVVKLRDFLIGRTEVTNDQYAVYAKAKSLGFSIPAGKGNQPVDDVSWTHAQGFAAWLSEQTGLTIRLPTEEEWEKACRGTDARIYPWGDSFDNSRLNSKEGGRGTTTAVGAYSPIGDSPYGATDMAGNVFEWTSSRFTEDYQPGTQPKTSLIVLRGGGYGSGRSDARCADRLRDDVEYGFVNSGLRMVVASFP